MAKRYLIVKTAAIGDVIMALPMVEEIRKLDKNADITWICGKSILPLLEKFSIDHIISIDDKKLYSGTLFQKLSVIFRTWRAIGWKKYDVIALAHADRRYRALALIARSDCYNMFSHKLGIMKPVPGRAHTDEYVSLINPKNKKRLHSASYKNVDLNPVYKKFLLKDSKCVLLSSGGYVRT